MPLGTFECMKHILLLLLSLWISISIAQSVSENETPTYDQLISFYRTLSNTYSDATLFEMGSTDSGEKLHLFILKKGGVASIDELKIALTKNAVLLINNGIHPGESCGIDASIQLATRFLQQNTLPQNVVIGIIPVYNIGGMLNRGSFSRANQLGPKEHGFRGNAQHLDLNRDFIKADALNTFSFYSIFQLMQPHLFVDTHTSNGADYQYTMTLISTQKDKLNPVLAEYLTKDLEPYLFTQMKAKKWEMTPYVNVFGATPNNGMAAFLETPRYASGYTTLFNTIGFITETHMLKPYKDRVSATRSFLEIITEQASRESEKLIKLRANAIAYDNALVQMGVAWKLDSSKHKTLAFKGYEYAFANSKVHANKRLKYLRDKPRTFDVPYYEDYSATEVASIPTFYVLPAAWAEVALRLQYNGVLVSPLKRDTTFEVSSTYINNVTFPKMPYEGHFLIQNLETEERLQSRAFQKGDYLIYTNQSARRFIINTLEANAADSYLRWNFFDPIFQQKEWFSSYVFEDTAEELLKLDEVLKVKYKNWQKEHPNADGFSSLYFIYKNSPYYEKEHLRYPVAKSVE